MIVIIIAEETVIVIIGIENMLLVNQIVCPTLIATVILIVHPPCT